MFVAAWMIIVFRINQHSYWYAVKYTIPYYTYNSKKNCSFRSRVLKKNLQSPICFCVYLMFLYTMNDYFMDLQSCECGETVKEWDSETWKIYWRKPWRQHVWNCCLFLFVNNIHRALSERIHIKSNLMCVLCHCYVNHVKIENWNKKYKFSSLKNE